MALKRFDIFDQATGEVIAENLMACGLADAAWRTYDYEKVYKKGRARSWAAGIHSDDHRLYSAVVIPTKWGNDYITYPSIGAMLVAHEEH